jgi:hypothetical protein
LFTVDGIIELLEGADCVAGIFGAGGVDIGWLAGGSGAIIGGDPGLGPSLWGICPSLPHEEHPPQDEQPPHDGQLRQPLHGSLTTTPPPQD